MLPHTQVLSAEFSVLSYKVTRFTEKPTTAVAEELIKQHALWNGGVFAYKLGYVLNKAHELIEFEDYKDLYKRYAELKKISFDYAVVEKETLSLNLLLAKPHTLVN